VDRNENPKMLQNLVHLSRLALMGEHLQVEAFVRRLGRSLMKEHPEVGNALVQLVSAGTAVRGERKVERPVQGTRLVPVDQESRWDLLRIEAVPHVSSPPVMAGRLFEQVEQLIAERMRTDDLLKADLEPSRTILFTGPPGVGKTLTAHWIAERLGKPLFTLDLTSVMSSLLGKTGNNLRAVLEYAKANDGVLLLDEFDAVAKRRNDDTEVGELKRLVTVILQEVDRWPADRLLIAATNHGDLLDPAIWRRFDAVINFPLPDAANLEQLLVQELPDGMDGAWSRALSVLLDGHSYSDVTRTLRAVRRQAVLSNEPIEKWIVELVNREVQGLSKAALKALSVELEVAGVSQRQIADMTGLSRDTIRRARQAEIQNG